MGRLKGSATGKHTLVAITCKRCNKTFYRRPSDAKTARYCSKACYFPPRDMAVCQGCGKEYLPDVSSWGLYCSMKCRSNQVEKQCPQCHKTFFIRASKAKKYLYCSLECRKAAHPPKVSTCKHCGKEITRPSGLAKAVYCSYDCEFASHRITIVCAFCGQEKTFPRYRVEGEGTRCCSIRCATLLRMREGFDPGAIGKKLQAGYRTDIEAMTEQVLIALNIPYLFEHRIKRYRIDFALPTLGIALECDGWYHTTDKGKAHDAKRDVVLAEEGWRVVRIPGHLIHENAHTAILQAIGI